MCTTTLHHSLLTDLYNAQLNEVQQTVVFWFIFFAFAVKLPVFLSIHGSPTLIPTLLLRDLCYYQDHAEDGNIWCNAILTSNHSASDCRNFRTDCNYSCHRGIVHGALIAIIQTDMKRIIAYSSFSHVGLMVAGIFLQQ